MPTAADQIPGGPTALARRVAALERELRELRAARRLENASIGSGGLDIIDGGALVMRTPQGVEVLHVGPFPYPHVDGSIQQATVLRREDGTVAFTISATPSVAGVDTQAVVMWDRLGNQVFSDDATSGVGLARPWLALPSPLPDAIASWPSTTSTSYTTVARSMGFVQHRQVRVRVGIGLAGNSGQIRLLGDGAVLAEGPDGNELNAVADLPNFTFGKEVTFEVQLRRTSGTGTVYAQSRYLYGG